MAKRKNRKSKAKAPAQPVDVLGHAKADIVVRDIPSANHNPRYVDIQDGPYGITINPVKGNPKTERAHVNRRESPVAFWYYCGKIDQHQYDMASAIRRWFEMAGGAGASAIDYERVKVDTSGVQEPISDARMIASDNLKRVSDYLDDEALYSDVHAICAQGIALKDRWPSSRARSIRSKEIQDALSDLADRFGYKLRKAG